MSHTKMKLIVGSFILSVLLLFSGGVYLLLQEKGVFDKRYSYHFTTISADYFHIGMPIKFSGFKIGEIDSIILNDNGSVSMSFSLTQKNKKWLTEGSILMLMKPLIGSSHIELYTALGTPPLKANSSIDITASDSINDLIVKLQPAVSKAVDILNNVHTVTQYLSREDSELKKILINLEKLSFKLANDDSLLTSMTGDSEATRAIVNSMKDTAKMTNDLTQITANINQDIVVPTANSIKELHMILKDIRQKLNTIDPVIKSVGESDQELMQIKKQISVGIQKSNQIMDKVDAIIQNKQNSELELP